MNISRQPWGWDVGPAREALAFLSHRSMLATEKEPFREDCSIESQQRRIYPIWGPRGRAQPLGRPAMDRGDCHWHGERLFIWERRSDRASSVNAVLTCDAPNTQACGRAARRRRLCIRRPLRAAGRGCRPRGGSQRGSSRRPRCSGHGAQGRADTARPGQRPCAAADQALQAGRHHQTQGPAGV